MDLVSIITPVYNSERYILATAQSIFSQSYSNWEWIIVDDCSTDDSLKVIEQFAKNEPRITILKNSTNLQAAKSRNRAIEHARGRYIAFIDSDDIWVSEKLMMQIAFMKKKDIAFSYHSYKKFYGDMDYIGALINVPVVVSKQDILRTCSIATLSVVYDTKIVGKVPMGTIDKREDLICWLKILNKSAYAYGMTESLGFYRVHFNSYSANKIEVAKLQWKVYREIEKLNLFHSLVYFFFYSLNGIIKRGVI